MQSIESLTPQQQEDYNNAHELASQANVAFDRRHEVATEMAKIAKQGVYEKFTKEEGKKQFSKANEDFEYFNAAASVLMPARAAFEVSKTDETLASEAVWQAMNPEQRKKSAELRDTLAEGPLKEHGVTKDTLRVVMREVEGQKKFILIHTGQGVDIGNPDKTIDPNRSYNFVMSEDNDSLFQVALSDGTVYDARKGMNSDVYDAKVADARERDVILPDSKPLSAETGDDWTWTMMTGEPLTADGCVQIAGVTDGGAYGIVVPSDIATRDLRVCPAVEI